MQSPQGTRASLTKWVNTCYNRRLRAALSRREIDCLSLQTDTMKHWVTYLYKVIIHSLLREIIEIACFYEITRPQHRMSYWANFKKRIHRPLRPTAFSKLVIFSELHRTSRLLTLQMQPSCSTFFLFFQFLISICVIYNSPSNITFNPL